MLAGCRVRIDVLDRTKTARRSLPGRWGALTGAEGPLDGLDAKLLPTRADWSDTGPLRDLLGAIRAEEAIAAGSSEGALFEQGSDDEICATLACLRNEAPADFAMAGSAICDDETSRRLRHGGPSRCPAARARGVRRAGGAHRLADLSTPSLTC